MKIPDNKGFQNIGTSHSSDVNYQDFINLYRKCTAKPYSFNVIDATLESANLSRFRTNL